MGRTRWTTPAQLEWLNQHVEAWMAHREKGSLQGYFSPLFEEFVEKFGLPKPSAKDIEEADGDEEVAAEIIRLRTRKRVYEWFFNNTPGRGTGRGSTKLLKELIARTRIMHKEQAYLRLFKAKLMPLIGEAYERHKETTPKGKRLGEFKFRNAEAAKMYAQESDAVKALVEKFRAGELGPDDETLEAFDDEDPDVQELREELERREAKKAKDRLKATKQIAQTIRLVLDNLEAKTGYIATILVAGKDPVTGQFTSYDYHTGVTPLAKLKWDECVADWEENVKDSFLRHARTCLGFRHLDDDSEAAQEPQEPEKPNVKARTKPAPAKEVKKSSVVGKQPARGRKKQVKTKATITDDESSDSDDEGVEAKGKAADSEDEGSGDEVDIMDVDEEEEEEEDEEKDEEEEADEDPKRAGVKHVKATGIDLSEAAVARHRKHLKAQLAAIGLKAAAEDLNNAMQEAKKGRKKGKGSSSSLKPKPRPLPSRHSEPAGSIPTTPSSLPGTQSTKMSKRRAASQPVARSAPKPVVIDCPEWVDAAIDYFQNVNVTDPAWGDLIQGWYDFLEGAGFPSGNERLSTSNRPEEIHQWLQNGRRYDKLPKLQASRAKAFASLVKSWWCGLQPKWRDVSAWPLKRAQVKGSWGQLARGGPNGIFLVVLAIAWLADGRSHKTLFIAELVADVSWVLKKMALTEPDSQATASASKRVEVLADETDDELPSLELRRSPRKRAADADHSETSQPKKKRRAVTQ